MNMHTTGPFTYENGFVMAGKVSIARVHAVLDHISMAERNANGKLLAASDDMLEALESIENDDGCIPDCIWQLRNKAIAKAKGQA